MKTCKKIFAPLPALIAILFLCARIQGLVHAQQDIWSKSPKDLFELIGNQQADISDRSTAFENLKDKGSYIPSHEAKDNIEAAYYLAECYVEGKTGKGGPSYFHNQKGFPTNRPESYDLAIPLYESAAEFGHLPSLVKLSAIYADEKYEGHDSDKSLAYLVKSVRLGDKPSLDRLLLLYANGFQGVTDEEQKLNGVEVLAQNGNLKAQIELSKHLISKNSPEAYAEARSFLVPLAGKGDDLAVALLSKIESKTNDISAAVQKVTENNSSDKNIADKLAADQPQETALQNQSGIDAQDSKTNSKNNKQAYLAGIKNDIQRKIQMGIDEQGSQGNSKEVQNKLLLVAGIALASICFAIIGVVWGLQEKVVVYQGRSDLALSCVTAIILLGAIIASSINAGVEKVGVSLWVLGSILFFYATRKSYLANQNSIIKTIVVVPAKIVLGGLVMVFSLAIIGNVKYGIELSNKASRVEGNTVEDKKERKMHRKEAADSFQAAAFSVGVLIFLHKLVKKLVKEEPAPK